MVADTKYNIQQYISREEHVKWLKLRKETETSRSQALLIGMTISKLDITFKHFLEKHTKQIIPDKSTLRKNYIDSCYEGTIEKIRLYVNDKKYGLQ